MKILKFIFANFLKGIEILIKRLFENKYRARINSKEYGLAKIVSVPCKI